jgi:type IV secretion system protein VirD4
MQRLLYHIQAIFSRLTEFFSKEKHLHNARFARLDELSSLHSPSLDETSLLLGVSRFNQILRVCPTETRRELGNLLVVAPTRGGKGLLATSQLLSWKHSVVVNDIKGELFQQTAGYRRTLGKVIVIDPTGIGDRYDPLMNKKTEDELLSAATQLLHKPDEGDGAIFTQRATVMLTQLFLAARAEGYPLLPYVRKIVRAGLVNAAERLNFISPELATQFLDIEYQHLSLKDMFLLSAWGTLSARMRPLLTETVVRCFTGADFTPGELMNSTQPITVYFRWPERDLLALSPLIRLLWSSTIDELITTYDTLQGKNCREVLLLIDEAGRTAIPSLADHATTVVGRGISLWIAIQSLSQLDAVYGKARAHILRDNMESQIYYRPSNQETADYLQHCLGKKSDYAQSQTMREGLEDSLGLSEQGVPLMTSQEIKQLRDEEIIGFHRRLPPFKARRLDWRCFPLLAQRKHIPPPKLSDLPELEEKPLDRAGQKPEPVSSWQLTPELLRRWSPPPSANGFRKQGLTDNKIAP